MHSIRGPLRSVKRTRSAQQIRRMRSFLSCSGFWSTKTGPYTRSLWTDYAEGKQTGYTAFMKLNIIRVFNDLPIEACPPGEL